MPLDLRAVPRGLALATVLGVLFLTFVDTTIVTVVLGDIQYTLGAGVIPLQWVVNGYALVFASLMLFAGSLGDRWGRKRLMVIGIAVFCAGSVVCAMAPDVGWLIAGRAIMGVGAAASEPGTLSLIRHMYPDGRRRARAIGGWAAVSGVSLALGPVIGGLLAAAGDWRTVFWFNLVLGALLLVLAAVAVPRSRDPQPGRLDVGGLLAGVIALGGLIFAAMLGEQYGYATPWIIALFVVGVIALAVLVVIERRVANPMVNLRYLGPRRVRDPLFGAFAIYFGVFSIFFFTALYLDLVQGYDGLRLAALFGPMAVLMVLGSIGSGFWVGAAGPRAPMITGAVIAAGGILLTRVFLDDAPGFAQLSVAVAIAGAGFGLAVVPVTSAVLGHVPAAHSGMAAGATNTARQLGSVIGVTALGALVSATITRGFGADMDRRGVSPVVRDIILKNLQTGGSAAKGLDFAHPNLLMRPFVEAASEAFRDGIHLALMVSAGLILASALVFVFSPRRAPDPVAEFG